MLGSAFALFPFAREIEPAIDLRREGWTLRAEIAGCHLLLCTDWQAAWDAIAGNVGPHPARLIVTGVSSSIVRARLLASGVSDTLSPECSREELAQRARRWLRARNSLPRFLDRGRLHLDLWRRDARIGTAWLALHPREFELLWHLVSRNGAAQGRQALLEKLWRRPFDPGTNTVAVHIRRLRLRLAEFGLAHSIVTDDKGRYWFDQQAAAQTVAAEERMPT